jgi:alpha-tubulin suppressor-like RCC1 family protein
MCSAKAKAVMIGAGNDSTCAVTTAGAATCWGGNESGQLGNGSTAGSLVPGDVVGLSSGVIAVSATAGCTCVVTAAGAVECWGSNGFGSGQLGNGTTTDSLVPVDVVGLSSGVVAVSTGGRHTCAVTSAGAVKCWGSNDLGELGNGSTKSSLVPVDVVGLSSGVVAVSAGVTTTCALLATGAVKCWGYNVFGQLGNDSTADSHVPVDVVGLGSGVVAVSAGSDYACAVTAAGAARCWGYNGYGQLGDGTTIHRHVPVDVLNLSSGVLAISTGDSHTCAVTATGAVACWGVDKDGELGDGSTTDSAVPVAVVGLPSEIVSVTVGAGAHTCAVTSTGGITCWGNDVHGQLGNGSMISSLAPVDVVGF